MPLSSLDVLQWGLVPHWAKDPKLAYKKRRCLTPADGFYEWKKVAGGKIPYCIGMKDDSPFVFAGLWEGWKEPATQEWLHTCTIITGEESIRCTPKKPFRHGTDPEVLFGQQLWREAPSPGSRERLRSECDCGP